MQSLLSNHSIKKNIFKILTRSLNYDITSELGDHYIKYKVIIPNKSIIPKIYNIIDATAGIFTIKYNASCTCNMNSPKHFCDYHYNSRELIIRGTIDFEKSKSLLCLQRYNDAFLKYMDNNLESISCTNTV